MVVRVTPNRVASCDCDRPAAAPCRISRTESSVSFAPQWPSPCVMCACFARSYATASIRPRCPQVFPIIAFRITSSATAYRSASSSSVEPARNAARAARTPVSVSLAEGASSPRGIFARPFRRLSALLSAAVPSHKCFGLQQGGLSQEWHAHILGGIGCPRERLSTVRCAYTCCFFAPPTLSEIRP